MQSSNLYRKPGQIYLTLVPLLVSLLGFGIGYISYKIYLPVWLLNVGIMALAAWFLGGYQKRSQDKQKRQLVAVSLLLIAPWMFISMFFGFGWFGKTPSRIYIFISLLAFIISLLPFSSEPFATAGFFISIPAVPFLMPYFIGINLLKRAGNES